jgi:hypothetical protein
MNHLLARLRARLTYANVTATLALFVALGGTSYAAASLKRNSVGSTQIRAGAVRASEIRGNAVHSSEIRDGTISLRDIAEATRNSLRGTAGPAGPIGPVGPAGTADRAAISSVGGRAAGTAVAVTHSGGSNEYTLSFSHDVTGCVYAATLAAVQNGAALEQPPAGGRITAAPAGGVNVLVRTYAANGSGVAAPFHLLVSC